MIRNFTQPVFVCFYDGQVIPLLARNVAGVSPKQSVAATIASNPVAIRKISLSFFAYLRMFPNSTNSFLKMEQIITKTIEVKTHSMQKTETPVF